MSFMSCWAGRHLILGFAFSLALKATCLPGEVPRSRAAKPGLEHGRADVRPPRVGLFDTGTKSPAPLSADSLADSLSHSLSHSLSSQTRWTKVPEGNTDHHFSGDAVMVNGRLAVVLRASGRGAEVYCRGAQGPTLRAVLAPAAHHGQSRPVSVAIAQNTPGGVAVEVAFRPSGGSRARSSEGAACRKASQLLFALGLGQTAVRTEARQGVKALRVEAPCRFVVLPDFFADDIVIDALEIPVARAELPSENFLLHMLPGREAIVMSVAGSRGRDAVVDLARRGSRRVVNHSEIAYGKDGKIWVAVIHGQGVWHRQDIAKDDADKVIRLDWRAPYPAQWRVDWRRDDGLTGSWEMIAQQSDGTFQKHGWFGSPMSIPENRSRWTTVLGRFRYPCWLDRRGRGYLQPLGRVVRFEGPALIYPINRVQNTPLSAWTVVDIVRRALGVGPCQYILDVEGQAAAMKGRATCAARDTLNPIYAAGQQKQKRAEIERALAEVLAFVKHIRRRIDDYVAFGHQMLSYLDRQKKAHPKLAGFLAEMETLTRAIHDSFEKRKDKIRTAQYVAGLTEKFRTELLDYEGDDALARCKAITGAIVVVGGNQDELVGECRMAVKILRQRAGVAMAVDPRTADIAREIRRRTQEVLRNPASYEAPRH